MQFKLGGEGEGKSVTVTDLASHQDNATAMTLDRTAVATNSLNPARALVGSMTMKTSSCIPRSSAQEADFFFPFQQGSSIELRRKNLGPGFGVYMYTQICHEYSKQLVIGNRDCKTEAQAHVKSVDES